MKSAGRNMCFLKRLRFKASASIVILGIFYCGGVLYAQSSATPTSNPKFDVASVRLGDPNVQHGSLEYMPESGKFQSNAATLDQLIGFAYDVRPHQIVGGPKWRGSDGFSIIAIADESSIPIPDTPAGTQMFRLMLRQLLADRFQLVAREENQEAPVYDLVVDKGGSKLKESTAPAGGGSVRAAPGELTGRSVPVFFLVNQLTRQLGRTVIDKTGLTGKYDFSLKWQNDTNTSGLDGQSSDSSGPTIFTAIREDLGLKLEPSKGPVRFVMIDRLEKPSAN